MKDRAVSKAKEKGHDPGPWYSIGRGKSRSNCTRCGWQIIARPGWGADGPATVFTCNEGEE
jgi:hypothetical protein